MRKINHDTVVNIRISTELHELLKEYASEHEQRTVSDVVRRLIDNAVSDYETDSSS